jgi:Spy/CpxP family protein refolding chaperone
VKGGFDMNMKRKMWSGIAVVALAATAVIPLIAQPPQAPPASQERVGPGRGGPGGPFPLLRGLNLTEAQREQVRALTAERRSQADNPIRKVADLERQLRLAIFADAPDQQKISELKGAIDAASAEALTARIDLQTRVAQILTDEQRAQAREALNNNAGRRGPAFGRRGGRARSGA